jgi:hypothetical protein
MYSDIVNLGDLEFVERSNKIRVEKLLNGVTVVLGEYNAPTKGASCTLYNSAGVALGTSLTGDNGQVDLKGIALIPRGLVSVACKGGTYTDEATGKLIDLGQMVIRAATMSEFWKAFLLMLKLVIDSWSESGSAVVKRA